MRDTETQAVCVCVCVCFLSCDMLRKHTEMEGVEI